MSASVARAWQTEGAAHSSCWQIENPTIDSPYKMPPQYCCFGDDSVTDKVVANRCSSSYLIPVPTSRSHADSADSAWAEVLFFDAAYKHVERNSFFNDALFKVLDEASNKDGDTGSCVVCTLWIL